MPRPSCIAVIDSLPARRHACPACPCLAASLRAVTDHVSVTFCFIFLHSFPVVSIFSFFLIYPLFTYSFHSVSLLYILPTSKFCCLVNFSSYYIKFYSFLDIVCLFLSDFIGFFSILLSETVLTFISYYFHSSVSFFSSFISFKLIPTISFIFTISLNPLSNSFLFSSHYVIFHLSHSALFSFLVFFSIPLSLLS